MLYRKMGLKCLPTTPKHLKCSGVTDRSSQTVKEWLAAKGGNWEEERPLLLLANRASSKNTIRKAPSQLVYGWKPKLPVGQEIGLWTADKSNSQELLEERQRNAT